MQASQRITGLLGGGSDGWDVFNKAREMIAEGALGKLRMVHAEYLQDWLSGETEPDNKQAAWRTDPAQAGGGAIGDIGTHAFNLTCFVLDKKPSELSATLSSFVPGRQVDDNARVDLRFDGGLHGHIWASQVAPGNENNLTLRIYGDKGGLFWAQENPNVLIYSPLGETPRKITRGGNGAGAGANAVTRIPGGHPEGYLEAFATLYSEAADAIEAHRSGAQSDALYPTIDDGLRGVQFVDACVRSSARNGAWVNV